MDVQVEKKDSCNYELYITLPLEDINKAYDSACKKISKIARIPGFRNGKAPKNLIQLHYKDQINVELKQMIVNDSYHKAIEQSSLLPVNRPLVDMPELKKGEDFKYVIKFQTYPKISLGKYKSLTYQGIEPIFEDVDKVIKKLAVKNADIVVVEDRDIVEQGDIVVLDRKCTIDNVLEDKLTLENEYIHTIDDHIYPDFVKKLIALKVPGHYQFDIVFSNDVKDVLVANKKVYFDISLKEIKKYDVVINDTFAKTLNVNSLQDLRKEVSTNIKSIAEKNVKQKEDDSLKKSLLLETPIEVPSSVVDYRLAEFLKTRFKYDNAEKMIHEESDFISEFRTFIQSNIKLDLLLLEIAKIEKIEVDDKTIDEEIKKMKQNYTDSEKNIFKENFLLERTFNFVKKNAIRKDPILAINI